MMVSRLDPDRSADICHWFLGCRQEAKKDIEHPTLGWVPICDEHIEWLKEDW